MLIGWCRLLIQLFCCCQSWVGICLLAPNRIGGGGGGIHLLQVYHCFLVHDVSCEGHHSFLEEVLNSLFTILLDVSCTVELKASFVEFFSSLESIVFDSLEQLEV